MDEQIDWVKHWDSKEVEEEQKFTCEICKEEFKWDKMSDKFGICYFCE